MVNQELVLEARLLMAYALIALIMIVGSGTAMIWAKRRKAHQRRMRGIKSYTPMNNGSSITN